MEPRVRVTEDVQIRPQKPVGIVTQDTSTLTSLTQQRHSAEFQHVTCAVYSVFITLFSWLSRREPQTQLGTQVFQPSLWEIIAMLV